MRKKWAAAAAAGALLASGPARAHDVSCGDHVAACPTAGQWTQCTPQTTLQVVGAYPATVSWDLRMWSNILANSRVETATDDLFARLGVPLRWYFPLSHDSGQLAPIEFSPAREPFTYLTEILAGPEVCAVVAGRAAGDPGTSWIEDRLVATYPDGQAQCTSVVACLDVPPAGMSWPRDTGATRDLEWWRSRPAAIGQCLAALSGSAPYTALLLGILWLDPATPPAGAVNPELWAATVAYEREATVLRCNELVFGTVPADAGTAVGLGHVWSPGYHSWNCIAGAAAAETLSALNASGAGAPLPAGYDPGPVDEAASRAAANPDAVPERYTPFDVCSP